MKIVFFGTPDFVIPILEQLVTSFTVTCVVTTPDHPQGRKKILTPSPVKAYALAHDIPTITPLKLTEETARTLATFAADIYVVAAYGKIIPQQILDIPRYGALNIHPSLLPRYRGPSPIQSALIHGDSTSGITVIKMDEKMDHGPIIFQETIPLTSQDTFESLHESMFKKAAQKLPEIIKSYTAGEIEAVEQNHAEATFCKMITKEDGYIPYENPPNPEELDRLIRALYPWPTAWTILRSRDIEDQTKEKILKLLPEGKVQLEGGKPVTIKDFLNGYPQMREQIEKLGLRRGE